MDRLVGVKPRSLTHEEASREITSQYIRDLEARADNVRRLTKIDPEPVYDDAMDNKTEPLEEAPEPTPADIFNRPIHVPPLMTLQQLRDYVPDKKAPLVEVVDPNTGVKSLVESFNRFQPNDPSDLLEQIPYHQGNSWCEQSLTCNDMLRFRAPFFFYGQRFDKLSKNQTEYLEYWQAVVRGHCERQKAEIVERLEAARSYNARLQHMRPPNWQTGLMDMSQSYAYRYKDMMKSLLGHGHHDRNSSRQSLVRFTIPFDLLELENIGPMEYMKKYCVLRATRISYYTRIFNRFKENRTQLIPIKKLEEPLNALMSDSMKPGQVEEIVSLLDIDDEEYALNANEFARICALAERLFYCENMRIFGEEGYAVQQGVLEMADFHMLVKKLNHVKLKDSLQRFLQRLDLFK